MNSITIFKIQGLTPKTVNWYIKRLSKKGFIKVKRIGQWQWKYILTPKGMKEKAKLTRDYVTRSMQLYRDTRQEVRKLLQEVKEEGYDQVQIAGENELVDVCRLTCLEQSIKVIESKGVNPDNNEVPILRVDGRDISLKLPQN